MSGPRPSTTRLSLSVREESDAEDRALAVDSWDSAAPSKFGFIWPSESLMPSAPSSEPTVSGSLNSSEDEDEEDSEIEDQPLSARQQDIGQATDSESIDTSARPAARLPRITRAFSMPLPHQLGHLRNPHRMPAREQAVPAVDGEQHQQRQQQQPPPPPPPPPLAPSPFHNAPLHDLSVELADCVQIMIQTLLQVSPPQILDPAKEQFSACSLSVPTPSMAAMFTAMKNLNYISANVGYFTADGEKEPTPWASSLDNFDMGELLQSVGDALSGVTAQAGVDLVLFHADDGTKDIKHVPVKGDETGTSYVLSHIIRQIMLTATPGDTIELGFSVSSTSGRSIDNITDPSESVTETPEEDLLKCTFDITHNFTIPFGATTTNQPVRSSPGLDTLLVRRLLHQLGANLTGKDIKADILLGRRYQLSLSLPRGSIPATPVASSPNQDIPYQLFSDPRIANEPTIQELKEFTDRLREKKVTLFANSKGRFAQHLTSYLTGWNLEISHVSGEGSDSVPDHSQGVPVQPSGLEVQVTSPIVNVPASFSDAIDALRTLPPPRPVPPTSTFPEQQKDVSFIFIDDDVKVLREQMQKLRAQHPYQLNLHPRKRPGLAALHRPRSSPQVLRATGVPIQPQAPPASVVILHFTTLANFKLVKDVIQSVLASPSSGPPPDVMIIPKPAGPRRILTALHTAVTKPLVDPFFLPIATTPYSPGVRPGQYFGETGSGNSSPRSPTTTRPAGPRTTSDSSRGSKQESEAFRMPPSPLTISEDPEYFSAEAPTKLGTNPSSGMLLQSPNGQPAGIFFHPGARTNSRSAKSRVTASRRPSTGEKKSTPMAGIPYPSLANFPISPSISPQPLQDIPSPAPAGSLRPPISRPSESSVGLEDGLPSIKSPPVLPFMRVDFPGRKSLTPPVSPPGERPPLQPQLQPSASSPNVLPTSPPQRKYIKRPVGMENKATSSPVVKKAVGGQDIIPPIKVLIVDDNLINQTILSTFMKKKKISFDVANNGREAVDKWRTGGYHLILMDIQMPVMDGIEATKEIRRIERANAAAGYPSTPGSIDRKSLVQTPSSTAESDKGSTTSPYRSSVIIVALTASSLQSDRVAALAAGCNDFLTKPPSLHWLNNKIIEWGSIKALQMWADLRPEMAKSISEEQTAQAQNIAQRLHVPEDRRTPTGSPSRPSSLSAKTRGSMAKSSSLSLSPPDLTASAMVSGPSSSGVTLTASATTTDSPAEVDSPMAGEDSMMGTLLDSVSPPTAAPGTPEAPEESAAAPAPVEPSSTDGQMGDGAPAEEESAPSSSPENGDSRQTPDTAPGD